MKLLITIFVGGVLLVLLLFAVAPCMLSSQISREEERRE